MNLMIEVSAVSKSYEGRAVLKDMHFTVRKGAIVGLLGPNGAGKTTMVRLLNGVIRPDGGTIRVCGLDPQENGDAIRSASGVVTEGAGLYHEMSGLANLEFFAKLYDVQDAASRIQELLRRFGLEEHQHKTAGTYSTGMKKRLALAKAMLHKPELLFLDEPTNGLDPEGVRLVLDILKKLNEEEGTTILLCSHVLHQLETLCHSYVFLDQGRIIDSGTLKEIESRYLRRIEWVVETGLEPKDGRFAGYSFKRLGEGRLQFSLSSKEDIPELLAEILRQSWVHTAEITNRSLESIYFEVLKGGSHHE